MITVLLVLAAFVVWMLYDCLTHNVEEQFFWAAIILCTPPIGAIIYAIKRPKLIGEYSAQTSNSNSTAGPPVVKSSTSSQLIKGVGMAIGIILGTAGMLFVGLIIIIWVSFSSGGGLGGSSK